MKEYVKIVTFVPEENADKMREALGVAGAGKIGDYSFCSYTIKGVSRFKPTKGADPEKGKIGELETVAEERIEVACEKSHVKEIIKVIKDAHPYEVVMIDVYQMLKI